MAVMKLLDAESGLMECSICGARHTAQVEPYADRFYAAAWLCVNGCKAVEAASAGKRRSAVNSERRRSTKRGRVAA